jgi:DNA repair protein RadC
MELLSSKIAAVYLREQMAHAASEELWVIALNPKCVVINSAMVFRGTVDSCFIHPRDIFRYGILQNASSLIVAHNHPSDDPYPSESDKLMTKKLREGADLLQIPLVDHIIVTRNRYFSFAESQGWGRKASTPSRLKDRFRPTGRAGQILFEQHRDSALDKVDTLVRRQFCLRYLR